MTFRIAAMTLASSLALAACATTGGPGSGPTEVSRYHLGQPIPAGSVSVEPMAGGAAAGLEFQMYADAVAGELMRIGFAPAATGTSSQYVAAVSFVRTSRGSIRTPPKFSIGIGGGGGGGYGGGVGLGGGISTGFGSKTRDLYVSELFVQLRRRSDGTVVWEGRAQRPGMSGRPDAQPTETATRLANALFRGFPGVRNHYDRTMTITVSAAFDSGAIRVVGIDGDVVTLEIPNDHLSDFYQWFHFRVAGARGRTVTFRIVNCAGSAYPNGWPDYRTRVSTDREEWSVAPDTSYDDGVLTWTHAFDTELAWFAYFQPYTLDRHDGLVAEAALIEGVTHRELGRTLDGRAIDCLTIGSGAKQVWLYARQHPGEPMAEWWMEGAIEFLTDRDHAVAATLREKATIHMVPNMNPDGSFRGHLRTNAAGINLNREWDTPSLEKSPEVLCVRDAMDESGVDFAMDIHGDEAIPANFLAGFEGIPSWTDALGAKFYDFGKRLAARTPDFQTEKGYGKAAPGTANLSMSTNQLAERFGAVAMTLEMPFKDHDPNPDTLHGWDGPRSKALAVSCLETLAEVIDTL